MKLILGLYSLFLSLTSFSQFAIIADKDGYVNVRQEGASGSKIVDTLHNDHLVFIMERKGNWTNIDYSIRKNDLNGYIYSDRLIRIDTYPKIPATTKDGPSYAKDSILVQITTRKFIPSNYRITYIKESPKYIQLINGRPYFGTDGEMPRMAYKSITVTIGERKIVLPERATEDLFEPTIHNTEVHYDTVRDILYIMAANSDGAGGYDVIWKIEKGAYVGRYVAYGF